MKIGQSWVKIGWTKIQAEKRRKFDVHFSGLSETLPIHLMYTYYAPSHQEYGGGRVGGGGDAVVYLLCGPGSGAKTGPNDAYKHL